MKKLLHRKMRAHVCDSIRWTRLANFSLAATLTFVALAVSQTPAPYTQQVAVMKLIRPGLTTIGVMTSSLSEKSIENIVRAAEAQGLKIIIAKPQQPSEIAELYDKLVGGKKIELLWIPDPSDKMLLGMGFNFLREKALGDKIGILVPTEDLVSSGALCSIMKDNGKLMAYVNERIAPLVGASVPSGPPSSVTYITK